jgi:hypothetical protein
VNMKNKNPEKIVTSEERFLLKTIVLEKAS